MWGGVSYSEEMAPSNSQEIPFIYLRMMGIFLQIHRGISWSPSSEYGHRAVRF